MHAPKSKRQVLKVILLGTLHGNAADHVTRPEVRWCSVRERVGWGGTQ